MGKIHFINIGSGDAMLLEENGEFALIDTNGDVTSGNAMGLKAERYLQAKLGTKRLKYAIITHHHNDHNGGIPNIIRRHTPEKVIMLPLPDFSKLPQIEFDWYTEKYYHNVVLACEGANCPIVTPIEGQTFAFGNGVLKIFNTQHIKVYDKGNYNDTSLGILYTDGNGFKSFLSGDMTYISEKNVKGKIGEVHLLRAGHHGYKGSSSAEFLDELLPVSRSGEKLVVFTNENMDLVMNRSANDTHVIGRYKYRGYNLLCVGDSTSDSLIVSSKFINGKPTYQIETNHTSTGHKIRDTWAENHGKWYFYEADGMLSVNKWTEIEGHWYRFDNNGIMLDNVWYKGTDGFWYYLLKGGKMALGWHKLDYSGGNEYFYFAKTSGNQHNKTYPKGANLYDEWLLDTDGYWYWLKNNGVMAKNETITINGTARKFDGSGRCLNP